MLLLLKLNILHLKTNNTYLNDSNLPVSFHYKKVQLVFQGEPFKK